MNGYFSFLYKMLEKRLWNSFLLYLVVEKLQKAVSQRCSIKEVFWKTSQSLQINIRSSHPEVFSQKIFLKVLQNSQKNIFVGVYFLTKLQTGNLILLETATGDVLFCKTRKIHRKKPVLESFMNKVAVLRAWNFIKEDPDTGIFQWN